MSDKFVFENAKIKCLENRLFTRQSVQRLLECASQRDIFRALLDMGFAAETSVEECDFDALFAAEEARQLAFIKEYNVAGALDAFLAAYDFLNVKLILKAKALGKRPVSSGLEGLKSFEQLEEICDAEDEKLPAGGIGDAVRQVRALEAAGKLTPRALDVAVDKAMYRESFSLAGTKLVRRYFALKADGINLLSYLRCKRIGLGAEVFDDGYIAGGNADIQGMADATQDAICEKLKGHALYEDFKKALDGGSLTSFEVACDDKLLGLVRAERDDMFGVAPILSYCLTRMTELKVAKLIVSGLINGVDKALIRERLRDVSA